MMQGGRVHSFAGGRACAPAAGRMPPRPVFVAASAASGPSTSGRPFDDAARDAARRLHQAGKAATRRMEDGFVSLGTGLKQTAESANERWQLRNKARRLGTQVQEQLGTLDRRSGFSRRLRHGLTDLLRALPAWQRSWRSLDPRLRVSLQCGLIGVCFATGHIRLLAGVLMTTWMLVAAGTGLFLLDALHKAAAYEGRQAAYGQRQAGRQQGFPGSGFRGSGSAFRGNASFPGGFPGGFPGSFGSSGRGGPARGPAADPAAGPVIDVEHQSLD